jgi:hypothetical protein
MLRPRAALRLVPSVVPNEFELPEEVAQEEKTCHERVGGARGLCVVEGVVEGLLPQLGGTVSRAS